MTSKHPPNAFAARMAEDRGDFGHSFYFPTQLACVPTLGGFLNKPWSQTSSVLPSEATWVCFLLRMGLSIPNYCRLSSNFANMFGARAFNNWKRLRKSGLLFSPGILTPKNLAMRCDRLSGRPPTPQEKQNVYHAIHRHNDATTPFPIFWRCYSCAGSPFEWIFCTHVCLRGLAV